VIGVYRRLHWGRQAKPPAGFSSTRLPTPLSPGAKTGLTGGAA